MRPIGAALALLLPVSALAACGAGTGDPGGASPSEARQLNEAAATLDANQPSNSAAENSGTRATP